MIGFVFPPKKLSRIAAGEEKTEKVQYYYDLAELHRVDLFFYSHNQIKIEEAQVKGHLYSYKKKQLEEKTLPIPKINLIRVILRKSHYQKLKEIEDKHKVTFINLIPERNKLAINHYLLGKAEVGPFIPKSDLLSYDTLVHYIRDYNKVIVKPINGSLGRGIVVVEKEKKKYIIQWMYKKKKRRKSVHQNHLERFFTNYFKKPSAFLIQPWIRFKTYKNEKYDIRISVQKDKNGIWQVTGIVIRVANKGGIVTNVAQGGRAISFEEISPTISPALHEQIHQLSLNIGHGLEGLYPATADLGLDIGIDEDNHLWFIEANYCDQRYAYREANQPEMWYASYQAPFEYAYFQSALPST